MTQKEKELEKRIERLEANSDIRVGGGPSRVCETCGEFYNASVEFHGGCVPNPERVKLMRALHG